MNKIKKTLIFRTDRLGDFLISCPFLISYKKKFHDEVITVVTSEYNFAYIKNFNFIDSAVFFKNNNNFFYKLISLLKLIYLLKKNKYKNIIILDGKNRSFFISLFLSGKKSILLNSKKLKFLSNFFNYKYINNSINNNQIKNFSKLAVINDFKINLNLNIYNNYFFKNKIYIFKKNYLIIHIDEKWFKKHYYHDFTDINPNKYEINKFIEKIIIKTKSKFDILVTTGSKNIKSINDFAKDLIKIKKNVHEKKIFNSSVKFINNTTFNEIEYLIKNSSFLICCEGGVSHVSHNLKIPTIAFYQKDRLKIAKHWTGHMTKLKLFERKPMYKIISDDNFFKNITSILNN